MRYLKIVLGTVFACATVHSVEAGDYICSHWNFSEIEDVLSSGDTLPVGDEWALAKLSAPELQSVSSGDGSRWAKKNMLEGTISFS